MLNQEQDTGFTPMRVQNLPQGYQQGYPATVQNFMPQQYATAQQPFGWQ